MTSKEKYDSLNEDDKKLITVLLSKGKTLKYISQRFGLSVKFVRCHLYYEFGLNYIGYLPIPICFGTKTQPYYKNEMDYGTLNLSYIFSDLSQSEKDFYNKIQNLNEI